MSDSEHECICGHDSGYHAPRGGCGIPRCACLHFVDNPDAGMPAAKMPAAKPGEVDPPECPKCGYPLGDVLSQFHACDKFVSQRESWLATEVAKPGEAVLTGAELAAKYGFKPHGRTPAEQIQGVTPYARMLEAQLAAKSGGLTHEQIVVACKNVGVDLSCGACAGAFYTGSGMGKHTCEEAEKKR